MRKSTTRARYSRSGAIRRRLLKKSARVLGVWKKRLPAKIIPWANRSAQKQRTGQSIRTERIELYKRMITKVIEMVICVSTKVIEMYNRPKARLPEFCRAKEKLFRTARLLPFLDKKKKTDGSVRIRLAIRAVPKSRVSRVRDGRRDSAGVCVRISLPILCRGSGATPRARCAGEKRVDTLLS